MRALLVVVGLALVAGASAQGTKGQTLRGYTFGSDVSMYLNISKDISMIKEALNNNTPNYKLAQAIYMDGANARQPDGRLFPIRAITTSNPGGAFWDKYAEFFHSPYWLDDNLVRAFGGIPPYVVDVQRVQAIVKGLESSTQFAFVMSLLDSAIAKTKAGKSAEAGKDLDAAWAVFVGGDVDEGLWTVTMKRAGEYGTKIDCDTSIIADNIRKAFLAAQKAIKAGDAADVQKARDTIQSQFSTLWAQALITYTHEMYLDKAANISAAEHQAEAYTFFRTIAPLLDAASPNASRAINAWTLPMNLDFVDDVDLRTAKAFTTAYKGLGITAKDIGRYGTKQPDLKCKAFVPTTTDGILTTTQAKDGLRPSAAPAAAAAPAPAAGGGSRRRHRLFRLFA